MEKKRFISLITFSVLAGITNVLIIVNSFIPEINSGMISQDIANFFSSIINANKDEEVTVIHPNDIELSLNDNYVYNHVDGYANNEIPIGCVKELTATVLPSNATNKSVYFTTNNEDVILTQQNSSVFINPLSLDNSFEVNVFTIDGQLTDSYTFKCVEQIAPNDFDISLADDNISSGLTTSLKIGINSQIEALSNPLMSIRYYDFSHLSYYSSNTSVATVDSNGIIRALSNGVSEISVSNGSITKSKQLTVSANSEPIIKPNNNWSITSTSEYAYINDMNYDMSNYEPGLHHTKLSIDWNGTIPSDETLTYKSSNSLIATVDQDGYVRGYRKEGKAVITAISNLDPLQNKTIEIEVKNVTASSIEDDTAPISIEKGSSFSLAPKVLPINTTDKSLTVSVSNPDILMATSLGNTISVYASKSGQCVITIAASSNSEAKLSYEITVTPRGIINNDNYVSFYLFVRKSIGHFMLFLLDGIFTTLAIYFGLFDKLKNKWWLFLVSLGFGFIMAGLSEFIQIFAPGRVAAWADIGIDALGYGISVGIICLIFWLKAIVEKNKKEKKNNL